MYDLGALIRSLRKERKITQKKLGEMIDVNEGTISQYETKETLNKSKNIIIIKKRITKK